jgi:RHS repeat-associated protein
VIWDLVSVEDPVGNTVRYTRWQDIATDGSIETYLDHVRYNSAQINFYYELRPDSTTRAVGRTIVETRYRLKTIDVIVDRKRARAYGLAYRSSMTTQESLLYEIREFGADATVCESAAADCEPGTVLGGSYLPPTTLQAPAMSAGPSQWEVDESSVEGGTLIPPAQRPQTSSQYSTDTIFDYDPVHSGDPNGTENPWLQGDVNGDGRIDFIGLLPYQGPEGSIEFLSIRTIISQGEGRYRPSETQRTLIRFDARESDQLYRFLIADIDGDRKSDLVYATNNDYKHMTLITLRSSGDGYFDRPVYEFSDIPGWRIGRGAQKQGRYRNMWGSGDVNGDGLQDLMIGGCVEPENPDCHRAGLSVAVSNGDGTFEYYVQSTEWSFDRPADDPGWSVGDVNGDGLSDFVRIFGDRTGSGGIDYPHAVIDVALSNGDGSFDVRPAFVSDFEFSHPSAGNPELTYPYAIGQGLSTVGDFNGDHRTDVAFFLIHEFGDQQYIAIVVAHSAGDGRFETTEYGSRLAIWRQNADNGSGGQNRPMRWLSGDFNADGRTDLLVAGPDGGPEGDFLPFNSSRTVQLIRLLSSGNGQFETSSSLTAWNFWCYAASWSNYCGAPMNDIFVGDVNGDRIDDVAYVGMFEDSGDVVVGHTDGLPTGSDFPRHTRLRVELSTPPGSDDGGWRLAEITADGLVDMVYLQYANPGYSIYTRTRDDDGTYSLVSETPSVVASWLRNPEAASWVAAEVGSAERTTPDGRQDLIHVALVTDRTIQVAVAYADGRGGYRERQGTPVTATLTTGRPVGDWYARRRWAAADLDGDGRDELVMIVHAAGTTEVHTLSQRSSGNWVWVAESHFDGMPSSAETDWRIGDVNGDGRADLTLIRPAHSAPSVPQPGVTGSIGSSLAVYSLLARAPAGTWAEVRSHLSGPGSLEQRLVSNGWHTAFINGDAFVDMVHVGLSTDGRSAVLYSLESRGEGSWRIGATTQVRIDTRSTTLPALPHYRLFDANGDGRTDLVALSGGPVADAGLGAGVVAISNLGTDWGVSVFRPDGLAANDINGWRESDLEGGGNIHLVRIESGAIRSLDLEFPSARLSSLTLATGGDIEFAYDRSSISNRTAPGCHLPTGVAVRVVSEIRWHDGRGTPPGVKTYSYDCANWSYRERRLLAWSEMTVARPAGEGWPGDKVRVGVETTDECLVQPLYADVQDLDGNSGRRTWVERGAPGPEPPFRCDVLRRHDLRIDGSGQVFASFTHFQYDEFGNVSRQSEYGDTTKDGDERATVSNYRPAPESYVVGLLSETAVYDGITASGEPVRRTAFCYDGDQSVACVLAPQRGLLTAVSQFNPLGTQAVRRTEFEYDSRGRMTASGIQGAGRTTYGYTADEREPSWTCNALAQCTHVSWDRRYDSMATSTDPNGLTTSWTYDAFGRPETILQPSGGETRLHYLDWGDAQRQRVREVRGDGSEDGLWTETLYDGLGRAYQYVREGEGDSYVRDVDFVGSSALVHRRTEWFTQGTDAVSAESFAYDVQGRLLRQTHSDGSYREWRYGNDLAHQWVTAIDESGRARREYSDAYGRRTGAEDASGRTEYRYNAADDIIAISDQVGNLIRLHWDNLRQLLVVNDPDRGTWNYHYDTAGNIDWQRDARGVEILLKYDPINRLERKIYPDGSEREWLYDEPSRGPSIGQLTSTLESGATLCKGKVEDNGYDVTGRLEWQERCVEGERVRMHFGYDPLDRQTAVTYPDGETVSYTYDAAGRLDTIPGYVVDTEYNASDRAVRTRLANGTIETRSYDEGRQWLASIEVRDGTSTMLSLRYERSADGLLESVGTGASSSWTFEYDASRRLRRASGLGNELYDYDSAGNLWRKSDVGIAEYPPSGPDGCGEAHACAHPHAPNRFGDAEYAYDANGNVSEVSNPIADPLSVVQYTWDFDNRLESVRHGDGRIRELSYDGSGRRVLVRNGPALTSNFGYVDHYAASTDGPTEVTKYIYAGSRLVASVDSAGASWMHVDELGSVRLVTDESGTERSRVSYTPFGSASNSGETLAFGYAGHRADLQGGLLYMKERYYDPTRGRFVSPDPVLSRSGSERNLASYNYAGDDPVSFVDPNGADPVLNPGSSPAPRPPPPPMPPVSAPGAGWYEIPPEFSGRSAPSAGRSMYPFWRDLQLADRVVRIVRSGNPILLFFNVVLYPSSLAREEGPCGGRPQGCLEAPGANDQSAVSEPHEAPTAQVDPSTGVVVVDPDSGAAFVEPEPSAVAWYTEKHHIMTITHKREFTNAFLQLLKGTNITLNDRSNLVDLPTHRGRHPPEYHMLVLTRLMWSIDFYSGTLTKSEAIRLELDILSRELLENPLPLKPEGWDRRWGG